MKYSQQAWLRALKRTAAIERSSRLILPTLMGHLADEYEAAPALISSEASFSYRELARRCNRYARWGCSQGLKPGETVFLLLPNCAEYLAVWLGLTRIGVIVALGNTNLSAKMLTHAVNAIDPRFVIVDATLTATLEASGLAHTRVCRVLGASVSDMAPIETELSILSDEPLSETQSPAPPIESTALYIYTSGTTGLPKAARVSHYRVMQWSHWFAGMMDTGTHDRMYNCLPMYHSVGGVVAMGATLVGGGAVVVRQRFSASEFWNDVRASQCTLFQYIGELCRYLVNSPPQAAESDHSLRLACGNGLRPEIWSEFATRFRIPRILEYYAATEGNFSLYNCEGEPGSIGRIPGYLSHRLPVELLRFDVDRGEPLRNAEGFCEACDTDEVGEAVGFIPSVPRELAGRFEGYADAEASERKIVRNAFKKADAWYRTGDLMRRDARGFYYFVDRVGDTYRWKGENVSTTEVLSVLTALPGVIDGVVYGVSVPGTDGRTGMAALIVTPDFSVDEFRAGCASRLPPYARPVFLRLLPRLEATSTFKPMKQELVRQGFDPDLIADPVYFDAASAPAFVRLDAELYARIVSGAFRL